MFEAPLFLRTPCLKRRCHRTFCSPRLGSPTNTICRLACPPRSFLLSTGIVLTTAPNPLSKQADLEEEEEEIKPAPPPAKVMVKLGRQFGEVTPLEAVGLQTGGGGKRVKVNGAGGAAHAVWSLNPTGVPRS